jgi:K+-transporting ATPase ATPase C chain
MEKARIFSPAIRSAIIMIIVTGIGYPLAVLIIGQSIFPDQSNGSLVEINGDVVGSRLIAQEFNSPKFFHPRPASESASGLDPHITPENAFLQTTSVSEATGIPENHLKTLVELNIAQNKEENALVFAPEYANVLELNIELVKQYPDVYSQFLDQRGGN